MPSFDARPRGLDGHFRPDVTTTVELTWPAGVLDGRTFTSTLAELDLAVTVDGDVMTVEVSAEQAATFSDNLGNPVDWALLEDLGGPEPEEVLVGRWTPSINAATRQATVVLTDGAVTVDVSVFTGGLTMAALASHEADNTAHGNPLGALSTHTTRLHRPFVHVTEDWLDRWADLRPLAASRLLRFGCLTDSVGVGSYADDWLDEGYLRVMADVLQEDLGDGGSGWIDASYLNNIFVPGGGQVTETGAWTLTAGGGVNGMARRPTVNGSGATVTFPFRGTTLDLIQKRGTAGNGFGSWDYRIDGGSAVTVSAVNATADIHTTTITGLAPGAHTVQVIANNGTCRIYGARGRNAIGFLLDNFGQGGRSFVNAAGGGVPITQATESIASGTDAMLLGATLRAMSPIDVLLIGMSVNDSNAATSTTEALLDVLGQVWDTARQMGTSLAAPPLPIFIIEHVGRHDADSTPEYSKHSAAFRPWAEAIGAAVVDYWSMGRNSWDYWASLTYWGIGNADNVHPNTAGHAAMAAVLLDLLAE